VGDEKAPPRTIKVVDRRRFTVEGDPRDDAPRSASPAPEAAPSDAGSPDPAKPEPEINPTTVKPGTTEAAGDTGRSGSRPATETSPEFVELVAMLAQQAELLLVGAEGLPAEPNQARRLIDYLVALEAKTAGNVSPEESQILSDVVFQLQTAFVQRR
jgi:hypothetical protein